MNLEAGELGKNTARIPNLRWERKQGGWVCFLLSHTDTDVSSWGRCAFPFAVRPPVCTSCLGTHDPRTGCNPEGPATGAGPPPNPGPQGRLPASFYSLYNINSIFKLHMNTVTAPWGRGCCMQRKPRHSADSPGTSRPARPSRSPAPSPSRKLLSASLTRFSLAWQPLEPLFLN